MHLAAYNGHLDAVRYLVEAGVSPDQPEDDGFTALHYAAEGQNLSSPVMAGFEETTPCYQLIARVSHVEIVT